MTEKKTRARSADRQRSARPQERPEAQAQAAEQPAQALPWREQAAFHVTLGHQPGREGEATWQTHAYHEESGEERVQPGILGREIVCWMRERAGLPAEQEASDSSVAEQAAGDLRLSIGALDVSELPAERQVGGPAAGIRLCARVSFELAGAAGYVAAAERARYAVQVIALDRAGGEGALLAACCNELRPDQTGYAEAIELAPPGIGSYQLMANVVVLGSGAAGVALGPVLNVVP